MASLEVHYKAELSNNNTESLEAIGSWSRKGLIAVNFDDSLKNPDKYPVRNVCIFDPNRPWEKSAFASGHDRPIDFIKWDATGNRLLTVDKAGCCKLWNKNHFTEKWEVYHTFSAINEERMIFADWIGNDLDSNFNQQHQTYLTTKGFFRRHCKPCITNIGGQKESTVIMVSCTGYVHIIFATPPCDAIGSCLGITRFKCVKATAAYTDNGKLLIAVLNATEEIEMFSLTILFNCPKYTVHIEYCPCLSSTICGILQPYHVTNINYQIVGSKEQLIVATKSGDDNFLQRFELQREQLNTHPQLKKRTTEQVASGTQQVWCLLASEKCSSDASVMCGGRLVFNGQSAEIQNALRSYLCFTSTDGKTLNLADSESCVTTSLFNLPLEDDEHVTFITFSPCDVCVLALTNKSNTFILVKNSFKQLGDQQSAHTVFDMFVYCQLVGISVWEVALLCSCFGANLIEHCISLVNENVTNKHTIPITYTQLAEILAHLFTIIDDTYYGVSICYNAIRLRHIHSYISFAFQSIFADREMNVMAAIRNLCLKSNEVDIRKLAKAVDIRETAAGLENLGQLQNFLHWAVEFCAQLSQLFLTSTNTGPHLAVIINILQKGTISLLKELLLLHYILIQSSGPAQPTFFPCIPFDYLPPIFKFFSKLKDILNHGVIDISSIDEVPLRSMPSSYYSVSANQPSFSVLTSRKRFDCPFETYMFQQESTSTQLGCYANMSSCNPLMMGRMPLNIQEGCIYDGVNCCYVTITKDDSLRKCNKCLCLMAVRQVDAQYSISRWVQRWLKECPCKGTWQIVPCDHHVTQINKNAVAVA